MFKYCYIVIVDCCCYIYNVDIYFFCYLLMTISTWRRKLEFELNNCKLYMLFFGFILYTNKYTPWFKWWIHSNLQKWYLLGLGFMVVAVSFIGEETGLPGENHRSVASHRETLSHNCCIEYTSPEWGSNSQH